MRFNQQVCDKNIVQHFADGVARNRTAAEKVQQTKVFLLQRGVDHDLNRSVDDVMMERYHDVERFVNIVVVVVVSEVQFLPPLRTFRWVKRGVNKSKDQIVSDDAEENFQKDASGCEIFLSWVVVFVIDRVESPAIVWHALEDVNDTEVQTNVGNCPKGEGEEISVEEFQRRRRFLFVAIELEVLCSSSTSSSKKELHKREYTTRDHETQHSDLRLEHWAGSPGFDVGLIQSVIDESSCS